MAKLLKSTGPTAVQFAPAGTPLNPEPKFSERHNFRVSARNFRRTDTVSGDLVYTADITMYRDGMTTIPQNHILRVDEKPTPWPL